MVCIWSCVIGKWVISWQEGLLLVPSMSALSALGALGALA